jgi:hypothetical protein
LGAEGVQGTKEGLDKIDQWKREEKTKGDIWRGMGSYVVIPWKIAVPVMQAVIVARADAEL